MDFGINVWFNRRAFCVLSITVYACKCIWTQKYLTSISLKFIKILKTSDCTNTQQSFDCKQKNSNSWHCDNIVFLKRCECLMDIWEGTSLWIEIVYGRNIICLNFPKVWRKLDQGNRWINTGRWQICTSLTEVNIQF